MKQNLNGAVAANRHNTSMMDIKLLQLIKKKRGSNELLKIVWAVCNE